MSRKKFTIWLEEETAERFRRRAIAEGRTLSESGAGLIEIALDSGGGGGLSRIRESLTESGLDEIKKILLSIRDCQTSAPSGSQSAGAGKEVWTKDAVINLLALVKGMSSLILFLSMKAEAGGHPERVRNAKSECEKLLAKLGYAESEGA